MNRTRLIFTVSLLLAVVSACSQKNSAAVANPRGTYTASTPCSQGTRPLPGIPVGAGCEFIKWDLTLYQQAPGQTPATFSLHCIYGIPKQGTTGFIGGGQKLDMTGKWTIHKGTLSNPDALIYRLTDDKTNKTISFLKLSDDLLHLLDDHQHLMIGTAAWSYTLNRAGKQPAGK